jgi:hypothetical protein
LPVLHLGYLKSFRCSQNNKGTEGASNIQEMIGLLSFQSYVRTLSNNIDENAACKKYKDFLADLSQSKVGRFFDANKDREWFRLKYHPNESQKMLHQQNLNFMKRLKIFNDLNDQKYFDKLTYNASNTAAIIDLMDAIIIQLEDGSQEFIERSLTPNGIVIDSNLRNKYIPNKPTSVVIDDINIETTLAEIQEVCLQASPELIRIAQLDPYYIEEGILRRKVIAVYSNNVDIRDVCWKLNRLKLNNRPLSVSINKCLTNRVLKVDAIANHHLCILNDIRNAIILIINFDELKGLYGKRKQLLENLKQESNDVNADIKMEPIEENGNGGLETVAPPSPPGSEKSANDDEDEKPFDVSTLDEEKEKEKKKLFEFRFNIEPSFHRQVSKLSKSKNQILEGAYTFLTEFIESSAARYQLSKVPVDLLDDECKEELKKCNQDKYSTLEMILKNLPCAVDESTKFLDKLLWYLRIVHSFDYYNFTLYRHEDDLTLKMGVIHVRGEPEEMDPNVDKSAIESYLEKIERGFEQFGHSQSQKYVTKDEERYNYKSYGKVITDELTSYSHKIQKPRSAEMEEVYKCRHCQKEFQKLSDIGRHFVSKHRWAIDAIELETDFFNAYLFDATKMNPCPPKELLELPPNRFAKTINFSHMGEDPDLLQQAIEAYSKMDSFVREPAPRAQVESDPRNDTIVDYTDISFDDAI